MTFDRCRALSLLQISPLVLLSCICSAQTNVLTYHNDAARTGQNLLETVLSPSSVNSSSFGKLREVPMDGKVDAQPLYVSGLFIPGHGYQDTVFAATEHDSVYAFDANSGQIFWHVSMLGAGEVPSDDRGCGQVTPEIGVTATPVIDLTAGPNGTIYVVAMSKDANGNYYHRLHALNIASGAEQFGGPQTIQATYPGVGDNSNGTQVVFDAKQYKDRPGLLLLNGIVYTSWGSHCDHRPYTGWIIGYDRLTLAQKSVFNFAPNGSEAALWNSGGGPAADSLGNIFVATGNGSFDTVLDGFGFPSRQDFGNSLVKLSPTKSGIVATDYWSMYNTISESNNDADLGSGGIMLLPDQQDAQGTRHLAVAAGKDGNLYVVDRDKMGKYDPTSDSTIYQQLTGALSGGVWSNPAYFDHYVYFGPVGNAIQAFQITNAKLSLSSTTAQPFTYPGATPSISASGSSNGILWAVDNSNPAVLYAYDAANLSTQLYSSNQAASNRDHFGPGNKFITVTIANAQVFVGTTNSVAVFSLLPSLPLTNGEYTITGQLSTLVLDDPAFSSSAGQQIIQWPLNGGKNQKWYFTSNGAGYYTIRNQWSGLYLADPGASTNPGTKLEQVPADGTDSQLWSLTISNSGYVIHNKASGLVIDDAGYSMKGGTGMLLWYPTGNSNQAWLIH